MATPSDARPIEIGVWISRFNALGLASLFVVPAIVTLSTGAPPGSAFLCTDPAMLGTFGLLHLSLALFGRFEPAPAPDAPAPSGAVAAMRRHGPRVGLVLVFAGALAMRPVVIRSADPTRQAFTLAKRSDEVRARLGSPLRLGWKVDGSITMGTNVDDVDVPPRIHARIPLLGPKGRGELTLVGRDDDEEDDDVAWTLQGVGVELEDGDRIDLVGSPPPPEKPWWIPPDYAVFFVGLFVALSALLGLVLGILRHRISVRRAVARADVTAGAPFELRFHSASRKHRVLLAFEVDHPGYEDDEGLTARLEIHAAGHAPAHIEHRIGDRAPAIGLEFTQNTARADVAVTSSGGRSTTSATVKLASIARTDGDVVVAGSVALAEGATARRLFVYVVPG